MRGGYVYGGTAWKEGKQVEDLVHAFVSIRGELKVVGRWIHQDYRRRIADIIDELGLVKRVEILGEVTEAELNRLYANARASVTAYEVRGFGLPALESAANGCAFVMPAGSGAARYFEKDVQAFYFGDGDFGALARYLQRLLDDERLFHRIGRSPWENAKRNY